MLREMKKILKITGNGWKFVFLLLLRSPVDISFTLIQATFLQRAFDAVGQNDAAGLTSACLIFGVASLCLFLYNGTVWSIYAPFAVRMERKLRVKLYDKISSFSYDRIESAPQGEWLTRLNADVEMPFSRPIHLPHAVCATVNICVSAIILWCMNPAVSVCNAINTLYFSATRCIWFAKDIAPKALSLTICPDACSPPPMDICMIPSDFASVNPARAAFALSTDATFMAG